MYANQLLKAPEVVVLSADSASETSLATLMSRAGFMILPLSNQRSASRRLIGDLIVLAEVEDYARAVETCRRLRSRCADVCILVVTKANIGAKRASLLEAGADQVLSLPYCPRELLASAWALVRRSRIADTALARVSVSASPGSANARQILHDIRAEDLAAAVHLTGTEYRILSLLAERNDPVSAVTVLETVFANTHHDPDSSLVRVHMHRLRRKLMGAGLTVVGIHGVGYSLKRR